MNTYYATFFSHFGAVRFFRKLRETSFSAVIMPVPRELSSSCGTCVKFQSTNCDEVLSEDIEHIFLDVDGVYTLVKTNM